MPNHCFQGGVTNPTASKIDFTVKFNADVRNVINVGSNKVDSIANTTATLCTTSKATAVIPASSGFSGTNSQVVSAIGLSGATIYNALDDQGRDAVVYEGVAFDDCLSHTMAMGGYHHHTWSPCLRKGKGLWNNSVVPANCKDTGNCYNSSTKQSYANTFALSAGYSTGTDKVAMEVIAIAKDGHVVYGPWDQNGNQWDCNSRDVCNGRFFTDGSYGYVATTSFPYVIGCWGPAVK